MEKNFLVETNRNGRTTTMTLSGELDLVSSPELEHALNHALDSDAELVAVDLRRLEFMDSTGLHLLVQAQQRAQETGRRLVLIRGSEQVQRLFDLTGVAEILTIVDSPQELFESASEAP